MATMGESLALRRSAPLEHTLPVRRALGKGRQLIWIPAVRGGSLTTSRRPDRRAPR